MTSLLSVFRGHSTPDLYKEVSAIDNRSNEFERPGNKAGGRKQSNNARAAGSGAKLASKQSSSRWPFGVPLRQLLDESDGVDTSLDGRSLRLPRIVERLGSHLLERGLRTEGLFRISGNSKAVETLRNAFCSPGTVQLDADVHASASLLKAFLRELPGGVVPRRLTRRLVELQAQLPDPPLTPTASSAYLAKLRSLFSELPSENQQLLLYIICLARRVAANCDANRMTPSSLGIVFGPTLFDAGDSVDMRVISQVNTLTCSLIENVDAVFSTSDSVDSASPSPSNSARKNAPPRPPPPSFSVTLPTSLQNDDEERELSRSAGGALGNELRLQLDSPRDASDTQPLSPVFDAAASLPAPSAVLSGAAWQGGVSPRSLADDPGRADSPVNLDSESASEWSSIAPSPRLTELSRPVQSTIHSTVNDLLFGPAKPPSANAAINTLLELDDPDSVSASTPLPSARLDTNNNGKAHSPTPTNTSAAAPPTTESAASSSAGDLALAQNHKARKKNRDGRRTAQRQDDSAEVDISANPAQNSSLAARNAARDRRRSRSPLKPATVANQNNGERANSNPNLAATRKKSNSSDNTFKSSLQMQINEPQSASAAASHEVSSPSVVRSNKPVGQATPMLLVRNDFTETPLTAGSEHDELTLEIHRLSNLRRELKAQVEQFEHNYLAEHGYRPSGSEKQANPAIRDTLQRLADVNLALKRTQLERNDRQREAVAERLDARFATTSSGRSTSASQRFSPAPTPTPSTTDRHTVGNTKQSSLANTTRTRSPSPSTANNARLQATVPSSTNRRNDSQSGRELLDEESKSIEGACRVILRELDRKRAEKGRPYDLDKMTYDEVLAEKQSLQRRLIWYEGIHGRPTTAYAKQIMRPVYERYRAVKRLVAVLSDHHGREPQRRTPDLDTSGNFDGRRSTLRNTVDVRIPQVPSEQTNEDEFLVTRNESQLNVALQRTSFSRFDLESELESLKDEKRQMRIQLKAFEDQFLRDTGRKVQKEDRQQRAADYSRYKQIKIRMDELERLLSDGNKATD